MIQTLLAILAILLAAAYCSRLLWLVIKSLWVGRPRPCSRRCDCELRSKLKASARRPEPPGRPGEPAAPRP
ncbi:MAG: hypothetical protein JXA90_13265 [Planctomycetes bacterium]|nr:hypothetical protein [Planctomycetota bacterium]